MNGLRYDLADTTTVVRHVRGDLVSACEHDATHHSPDLIEVHHGAPLPRVLCGYHAMREGW